MLLHDTAANDSSPSGQINQKSYSLSHQVLKILFSKFHYIPALLSAQDKERSRASTSETDSSGGTRQQADESLRESTVLTGSSGSGEPVVEKELAPEISGIVISAQGGGNASVQKEISEAMQALFGLPAHKIKVLKRVE